MDEETWPLRVFRKSDGLLYLASNPNYPARILNDNFEMLKIHGDNWRIPDLRTIKNAVSKHIMRKELNANAYQPGIAYFSCFWENLNAK